MKLNVKINHLELDPAWNRICINYEVNSIELLEKAYFFKCKKSEQNKIVWFKGLVVLYPESETVFETTFEDVVALTEDKSTFKEKVREEIMDDFEKTMRRNKIIEKEKSLNDNLNQMKNDLNFSFEFDVNEEIMKNIFKRDYKRE